MSKAALIQLKEDAKGSDTINQQQERAQKVKDMDSMCVTVKGKQTIEDIEESAKTWKPQPNVQLPSGKWAYHPDFDIKVTTPDQTVVDSWEHAHVLPNGLLKDESGNSSPPKDEKSPPRIRRLPCVRPTTRQDTPVSR